MGTPPLVVTHVPWVTSSRHCSSLFVILMDTWNLIFGRRMPYRPLPSRSTLTSFPRSKCKCCLYQHYRLVHVVNVVATLSFGGIDVKAIKQICVDLVAYSLEEAFGHAVLRRWPPFYYTVYHNIT